MPARIFPASGLRVCVTLYRKRVHILVIEDEPAIADFVQRGLTAEGYEVETVHDGVEGERRAQEDFDLIILDVMLPGRDGLEILRGLRAAGRSTPVIMLTARGEINDRVSGLDAGATDYLVKPFAFSELAARVRTHLRNRSTAPTVLRVGQLELDRLGRRVLNAGQAVALSPRELDLLGYFMAHPGRVLSRERLLSAVWGYDFDPKTNVVEVYVGYLRRKLTAGGEASPIETVRSVGYRLRAS
jgi:DNA-binding response OmpR family regulator